jgi:uncharacterized protein (TIGR00297 family)
MKIILLHFQSSLLQLLAGFAISLAMAFISYRFKAISFSGSIGMIIIGTIIFGLGGLAYAIPLIFFFISSSILTAIKTKGKSDALIAAGKTGPRDIWQVMANGGVGAVYVIIYFITGNIVWFFPYLASLCKANSDTWATEIGTLFPYSPISIVSLKKVDPGQSGGITFLGTLAAIAGALAMMLVAYGARHLHREFSLVDTRFWLIAANCGFAGSILNSVVGASIQAQYRCRKCHHLTENPKHCGDLSLLIRGFRFINNDLVNRASCLFAGLMTTAILLLRF